MNGLVDGMLYEVLKVFARLLAPDSLLLEDGHADDEDGDNSAFVSGGADPRVPRSGDIVLTSTPGSFFLFWRMLTRQRYDHVSLVLDNGMAMHVGPPTIRLLPLSRLVTAKRRPFVLRPNFGDDAVGGRHRLVAFARGLHRKRYDYPRAVTVLVRLCLEHQLGLRLNGRLALAKRAQSKWICSDAIMAALTGTSPPFAAALASEKEALDFATIGSMSPEDYFTLHRLRPEILQRVRVKGLSGKPELRPLSIARSPLGQRLSLLSYVALLVHTIRRSSSLSRALVKWVIYLAASIGAQVTLARVWGETTRGARFERRPLSSKLATARL